MNKKAISELYRELPELVAKNIISPEAAQNIRDYYGDTGKEPGKKMIFLVFGVLGGIFIGLGIILLIAHNWDNLARLHRFILCIMLLVSVQAATVLVIWFKDGSKVWRESVGTLHALVIGAVIALVGQTYHLSNDVDMFMLTWMIFCLPLVYVLRANSVAVLYCLGIAFWCVTQSYFAYRPYIGLAFILIAPFYWRQLKEQRDSMATAISLWALNIAVLVWFIAGFSEYIPRLKLIVFSTLFGLNYLIGRLYFYNGSEKLRMPFAAIGLIGLIYHSFFLTFKLSWNSVVDYYQGITLTFSSFHTVEIYLSLVFLALVIAGNAIIAKKTEWQPLLITLIPLVISSVFFISVNFASNPFTPIIAAGIMNCYLVFLSVWVIYRSTRTESIAQLNSGIFLLGALIITRFFDGNFNILVRGFVFVGLGAAFLIANWFMARKKAGSAK